MNINGGHYMRKYSNNEFREKVYKLNLWVKTIDEEYTSTKEEILVTCDQGHQTNIRTKSLTRSDHLKECPICRKNRCKKEHACVICGKMTKNPKYCSHSCSAKANNSDRKNIRLCEYCNKEISGRYRSRFCSNNCSLEFNDKRKIDEWKRDYNVINGEYTPRWLKRYFLKKYKYKCEKCGWGERNTYTDSIPLQLHHKNGVYSDYREENLQLLCPNCHSLTENFGGRNTGNR